MGADETSDHLRLRAEAQQKMNSLKSTATILLRLVNGGYAAEAAIRISHSIGCKRPEADSQHIAISMSYKVRS
jgi:hypothetical protein